MSRQAASREPREILVNATRAPRNPLLTNVWAEQLKMASDVDFTLYSLVLHKAIGAPLLPLKLLQPRGINTPLQVSYLSYLPLLPALKEAYVQCNKTLQQITAAELWMTRGLTYAARARRAATEASS